MTDQTLLALALCCEQASEPDRELDFAIAGALGWYQSPQIMPGSLVRFSASLDAAMTLLTEAALWRVGHDGEGADPSLFAARVYEPQLSERITSAVAETPALALTAAALRAQAIRTDKEGADG